MAPSILQRSLWRLLAGAALLLLAAAPLLAQAQRSLECQQVWTQPSSSNDLLVCLKNGDRIKSQWRYYVWPGLAVIIFLFILIFVPILFCCRCCCANCCSGCIQPSTEKARKRARCWLWMWFIFAILWACCVCVLVIYGASLVMSSSSGILDDLEYKTLDYFVNTKNSVVELTTNKAVNPPTPLAIDLSPFDDVDDQIRDKVHIIRNDYFKYFRTARIVSYCIGAVGVVLMLLLIFFVSCQCGGCCPLLFSLVYYVFGVIYALLAVVFTLLTYVLSAGCGEVTLQYKREPGVFQWYLVPWCEGEFNFQQIRSDLAAEVLSASQQACEQLLTFCDNFPEYPNGNPDIVFNCGNGIVAKTECTTLDFVFDTVQKTVAKPILTNTLCANNTGMEYFKPCTIDECAQRCVDYEHPAITPRTWATDVSKYTQFAMNASTALSFVTPLLQCDLLVDKIASAVATVRSAGGDELYSAEMTASHCSTMHTGIIMLGAGYFVGALMFLVGVYVLHRGSFVWNDHKDVSGRT